MGCTICDTLPDVMWVHVELDVAGNVCSHCLSKHDGDFYLPAVPTPDPESAPCTQNCKWRLQLETPVCDDLHLAHLEILPAGTGKFQMNFAFGDSCGTNIGSQAVGWSRTFNIDPDCERVGGYTLDFQNTTTNEDCGWQNSVVRVYHGSS